MLMVLVTRGNKRGNFRLQEVTKEGIFSYKRLQKREFSAEDLGLTIVSELLLLLANLLLLARGDTVLDVECLQDLLVRLACACDSQ